MTRPRTAWTKGNGPPTKFRPGQSGNPLGRPKLVDDIAGLVEFMRQREDPQLAMDAMIALLDRGFGKPPIAVFAQVNGTVAMGGIDGPPPIIEETDEQWLERRRAELAALEGPRREPPPASPSPAPAGSPTRPPNGETAVPGAQTGTHGSTGSSVRSPEEESWLRQQRRRLGIAPERD
jgi:hypothetical protein